MKRTETRLLRDLEPSANPFEIEGKDQAVLLVHGFTGTPAELRPVGQRISESLHWKVKAPLLPGHGTTVEDLATKRMEDWISFVETEAKGLTNDFLNIHLLGLSMGAALCLEFYRAHPDLVSSLILLAPAVWLRSIGSRALARIIPKLWLPSFLRKIKKGEPLMPGHVAYEAYPTAAVGEFQRVCDRIRTMSTISAPTLLIYSEADSTIALRSGEFLAKRLKSPLSRTVRLMESDHILTLGSEGTRVTSEIISFLKSSARTG